MRPTRRICGAWLPPLLVFLACDAPDPTSSSRPATDGGTPDPASAAQARAPTPSPPVSAPGEEVARPSEAAIAETPRPQPEPQPALIEDKTVLILGSSLAATGFGALLEKKLHAHAHLTCHRKAKSATGLARADFYDWPTAAEKEIEARDPDLVVIIMGANDGQDLVPNGSGKRVRWKTEGWEAAYRERVDAFVALLAGEDRQVLWLGIPRTNTTKLEAKLRLIRSVHEAAAQANDQASYVDLSKFVENEDGHLIREAQVNGKRRTIRGEDGVHFTMSGSRYLADSVYPEVLATLGLPEDEFDADD